MKTLLATLTLAVAATSSAHAQMYQPAATRGAVLGAIAGAFVGGHNNDRWAEGAVIGGVAGALLGAAVAPDRVYQPAPAVVYQQPAAVVQPAPIVPCAPVVQSAPVVVQPAPEVVYVQPAPRVVYVQPAPRVVYVPAPPVVRFGIHYSSGPRYDNRGHGRRH